MFETGSDRRVFCPASSAACGKHSGDGERDSGLAPKVFGIAPERRSPSGRNRVRDQPGIVFGFIPESRSASPGFPTVERKASLALPVPNLGLLDLVFALHAEPAEDRGISFRTSHLLQFNTNPLEKKMRTCLSCASGAAG
jgi:hypothetical protein